MFGSYLVELVLGLSFLFAVLGIVTSAVTEALLSSLKKRSAHLNEWMAQWAAQFIAGQGKAGADLTLEALKKHPLIASAQRGAGAPSYLAPEALAGAMLQLIAMPFSQTCIGKGLEESRGALQAHIDKLHNTDLKNVMQALLDRAASKAADGSALVARLQEEAAAWIDSSMDRIEGWTKRYAKRVSLVVALVLCAGFNVSALEVMRVLSADSSVRTELAGTAVTYVQQQCSIKPDPSKADAPAGSAAQTQADKDKEQADRTKCLQEQSQHAIEALGTPSRLGIGWEHKPAFLTAKDTLQAVVAFVVWLVGVVAAAFAASLGGDFWFKWIGDIVRLTGYKPVRKIEPAPADPQTVAVIERLLKAR